MQIKIQEEITKNLVAILREGSISFVNGGVYIKDEELDSLFTFEEFFTNVAPLEITRSATVLTAIRPAASGTGQSPKHHLITVIHE